MLRNIVLTFSIDDDDFEDSFGEDEEALKTRLNETVWTIGGYDPVITIDKE